jgi:hypothetical protein
MNTIQSACASMHRAIASGDKDMALHYLSLAINRYHAERFNRAIDDLQATLRGEIPDNPTRVAPPDHLTENGYADDPDFQEREERRHEFEADRDRVNDQLWETNNG